MSAFGDLAAGMVLQRSQVLMYVQISCGGNGPANKSKLGCCGSGGPAEDDCGTTTGASPCLVWAGSESGCLFFKKGYSSNSEVK